MQLRQVYSPERTSVTFSIKNSLKSKYKIYTLKGQKNLPG